MLTGSAAKFTPMIVGRDGADEYADGHHRVADVVDKDLDKVGVDSVGNDNDNDPDDSDDSDDAFTSFAERYRKQASPPSKISTAAEPSSPAKANSSISDGNAAPSEQSTSTTDEAANHPDNSVLQSTTQTIDLLNEKLERGRADFESLTEHHQTALEASARHEEEQQRL
eukprot:COSAG01_NODE_301_length_19211_cov_21.838478_16_plen_168_part_01